MHRITIRRASGGHCHEFCPADRLATVVPSPR
jgi:hypothetical protein